MTERACVILAGGRGERFWPRSRTDLPKQFLPILGEDSLLQRTYTRALGICAADAVYVVTAAPLAARVCQQIPDLAPDHVLAEPAGRDTAAALAFAMSVVGRRHPGAVAACLPADHLVVDDEAFRDAVEAAIAHASRGDRLVLIGVRPTRPETAYGYILPARPPAIGACVPVARFQEKPSREEALRLVTDGQALWNSGLFIWRPEVFLAAAGARLPAVREAAAALADDPVDATAQERYAALAPLSVDYGLIEGADNVSVVPGRFLWDDVGNWGAVGRLSPADGADNVVRGRALAVDSRRVTVDSTADRLVVAFGLEDVVIVDSGDAVLVAASDRATDMKRVTQALREHGYGRYLEHTEDRVAVPEGARVVPKPWGREVWWAETDAYLGKLLEVEPGQALSMQLHHQKHETMLVLRGTGTLTLDGREIALGPGVTADIAPGSVHRLRAGDEALVVMEVSTAHPDDVVRIEDRYRRTGGADGRAERA